MGRFWGVPADDQWHHADVNLLAILQQRYPGLNDYKIGRIRFADWDGGDSLFGNKYFGRSSILAVHFDVDNFHIGTSCTSSKVTFGWKSIDEAGIAAERYLIDREPNTIPLDCKDSEAMQGEPPTGQHTFENVPDGPWWFHVQTRDPHGNWSPPGHHRIVVDTKPPDARAPESFETPVPWSSEITVPVSDEGSGVDPAWLTVEVDGRVYPVDDATLSYDPTRKVVLFQPKKAKPYPVWSADGCPVTFRLSGIRDFAGHQLDSTLSWTMTAGSPVRITNAHPADTNGWCTQDPEVGLSDEGRQKWSLGWMRSLKGDKLADEGCSIRELALVPKVTGASEHNKQDAITLVGEKEAVELVVEVKVDKTIPKTTARIDETPPSAGKPGLPLVTLSHSEYAYRRGGLHGRYFRGADFQEEILRRIDPFVYFFDERPQHTPPVPFARSAVWEGGLYCPKTQEAELELAIWYRAPASGRAYIDGDLIFDLRPEQMAYEGFTKGKVILVEGMHRLRLEFSDPSDRLWSFALFRWGKNEKGQETREVFGPKELYYLENLGKTYFRWNEGPVQTYTSPFDALPGKNLLRFFTLDQAGHQESEQILVVDEAIEEKARDTEELEDPE